MKRIALLPGNMPRDIEFPDGIERSSAGAISLTSGTYRPVTDAELEHIKTALPALHASLDVIAE